MFLWSTYNADFGGDITSYWTSSKSQKKLFKTVQSVEETKRSSKARISHRRGVRSFKKPRRALEECERSFEAMKHSRHGGYWKEDVAESHGFRRFEGHRCGFATERNCSRCREAPKCREAQASQKSLLAVCPTVGSQSARRAQSDQGVKYLQAFKSNLKQKYSGWLPQRRRPGGQEAPRGPRMTTFWKEIENEIDCWGVPMGSWGMPKWEFCRRIGR